MMVLGYIMLWANNISRFSTKCATVKGSMVRGREIWVPGRTQCGPAPHFIQEEMEVQRGTVSRATQWVCNGMTFLRWSLHNICFPLNTVYGKVS